jgi:hypothetical protein
VHPERAAREKQNARQVVAGERSDDGLAAERGELQPLRAVNRLSYRSGATVLVVAERLGR